MIGSAIICGFYGCQRVYDPTNKVLTLHAKEKSLGMDNYDVIVSHVSLNVPPGETATDFFLKRVCDRDEVLPVNENAAGFIEAAVSNMIPAKELFAVNMVFLEILPYVSKCISKDLENTMVKYEKELFMSQIKCPETNGWFLNYDMCRNNVIIYSFPADIPNVGLASENDYYRYLHSQNDTHRIFSCTVIDAFYSEEFPETITGQMWVRVSNVKDIRVNVDISEIELINKGIIFARCDTDAEKHLQMVLYDDVLAECKVKFYLYINL
jgi:hypothetical protein